MCMNVCIYPNMYAGSHLYMYVHTHILQYCIQITCVCIYVYVYMYVGRIALEYMCVSKKIHTHFTHIHMQLWMNLCVYTCMCIYIWYIDVQYDLYTYAYINKHVCA